VPRLLEADELADHPIVGVSGTSVLDGFERAWVTGDVDAVLESWTDDAVMVSDGKTVERAVVASLLCESIQIDPVRKRVTGDGVV